MHYEGNDFLPRRKAAEPDPPTRASGLGVLVVSYLASVVDVITIFYSIVQNSNSMLISPEVLTTGSSLSTRAEGL